MKKKLLFFSSDTDRWGTPATLYATLQKEFSFNFDPCPLDGKEDGLAPSCQWEGKRVYCNPPYGPIIKSWLLRGLEAELAVFLLPSRTDAPWFHEIILPSADEVRFIRGRLKFSDAKNPAPFASMIVIFRNAESMRKAA